MKLLAHDFTTAASTFCGTTGASGGASSAGGTAPVGKGSFKIDKIAFNYGTSGSPNSSGGLLFRYGPSSAAVVDTLVLLGSPTSVGVVGEYVGFDIQCNWFEAEAKVAGDEGATIFVFGI